MENLRLSDNNRDLISNMDYFLGMGFVIGVSVGVAAPVIGILLNYFNQN